MSTLRRLLLLPPRVRDLPCPPPGAPPSPDLVEAQRKLEMHQNTVARLLLDSRVAVESGKEERGEHRIPR